MIDIATGDPRLSKLIDLVLEHNMKLVNKWLELEVEMVSGGDDLGTQKGLPVSPRHFRKYLSPCYAQIFGICRDAELMKNNTVTSLLHLIKERYPQERVEATKQRLQTLWNLQPMTDRIPYVLYGMPLKHPPALANDVSGEQRELITQLQTIYEHAEWLDDYVPGLVPGICQVMIPTYFGCTEERTSMTTRVKPVVHDPRDVYDLPEVGFGPETPGGQMLERMRYFRRETRGLLPIYEADLQGPFSVASQVWGIENFLAAIYEYPDEVHHLLSRCTDAVIKFAELMREAVDGDWIPYHCVPAVWLPPGKAIAISEDLVAVVSPQVVRDFMRPCLERIAAAFGGVFLHSCGSINHVIGELNQVPGLIGLNFSSSETDYQRLAQELTDAVQSRCKRALETACRLGVKKEIT